MATVDIIIEASGETSNPSEGLILEYADLGEQVDLSLDDNTDITSYLWTLEYQPTGASVTLTGSTTATPYFISDSDATGTYLIKCSVNSNETSNTNAISLLTENLSLRKPAVGEFHEITEYGWAQSLFNLYDVVDEISYSEFDYNITVLNITALRLTVYIGANEIVIVRGHTNEGDGGEGLFYWDATSIESDNGGTIIQATGISTGRWKRIYNKSEVHPEWWGGFGNETGDGTGTNCTTAINSAFTLLSSSGGRIILKHGSNYLVTNEVGGTLNNVTFTGYGATITTDTQRADDVGIITILGSNIVVEGLTTRYTDGNEPDPSDDNFENNTYGNALRIGGETGAPTNVTVRDCRFYGAWYSGIRSTRVSNLFIENCYIENTMATAIFGIGIGNHVWVKNCHIKNTADDAIHLLVHTNELEHVVVSGNKLEDIQHGYGLTFNFIQNLSVTNNSIVSTRNGGMRFNTGDNNPTMKNVSITGNHVVDAGQNYGVGKRHDTPGENSDGIFFGGTGPNIDSQENFIFSNNTFINSYENAIYMRWAKRFSIKDNLIVGTTIGDGIQIGEGQTVAGEGGYDVSISGNVIINPAKTGIIVVGLQNYSLNNNIIRGYEESTTGYGIRCRYCNQGSIQGNTIYDDNSIGLREIDLSDCGDNILQTDNILHTTTGLKTEDSSIRSMDWLRVTPNDKRIQGYIYLKEHTSGFNNGGGWFYWDATSIETDNNGTIIQVTGVVTGRWKRVYSGKANAKWFGATGDGSTNDTDAIEAARIHCQTTGEPLYFPTGTYMIDGDSNALNFGTTKHWRVIGDGVDNVSSIGTCLQARTPGSIFEVSGGWNYGVEIAHLTISGYGETDSTLAHGLWFHDNGPYAGMAFIDIHDIRIANFSGNGLYFEENWHTKLENIVINTCGRDLFNIKGGNTCTFIRCYAQNVHSGYAGYRVGGGFPTFIGCNGINNGPTAEDQQADWGVFGRILYDAWTVDTAYLLGKIVNNLGHEYECLTAGTSAAAGDGPDEISVSISDNTVEWRHVGPADLDGPSYSRPTFIGCNVEYYTRHGIRLKMNSSCSLHSTSFLGPDEGSGPYIAVWVEYMGVQSGFIDSWGAPSTGIRDHDCGIHTSNNTYAPFLIHGNDAIDNVYMRDQDQIVELKGISAGSVGTTVGTAGIELPVTQCQAGFGSSRIIPTYGPSIAITPMLGNQFLVTADDTVAFTIAQPPTFMTGQQITITIRNDSGGSLGTITWNTVFRLAGGSFTSPADGYQRSVTFEADGSNYWLEVHRTSGDVQNP